MSRDDVFKRIAESLASLNENELKTNIKNAVDGGVSAQDIIRFGIGKGMEIVGERYEKGEYFLSELIMAGVTMKEATDMLRPLLKSGSSEVKGTALIGTVEGDLHDLGKNLVITMLTSAGFEVRDLGTDVSPRKFVEETRELRPNLVCMSALLSVVLPKVKETVDALREAGFRDSAKVLVGGRCLNRSIAKEIGADSYGEDAWDAVRKARELLSG